MRKKLFNNLLDVVPPEFLRNLLTQFSEATGVKTLIADYQGRPLIWPDIPARLCAFCSAVRDDPYLNKECEKNDAFAGITASQTEMPLIYRCYMGRIEVAVPIIVNSQYLGVVMIGQFRIEDDEHEQIDQLLPSKVNLDERPDLLELYVCKEQTVLPLTRLKALVNMLHTIANYIAEISVNSHLQESNSQLNMRILQEENKKNELEKNLKQLELQNMQKHLNPHFLFNTLNTINNLVLLEDPQQASEIISSLSKILRRSLYTNDQLTDLADEYEAIQNYMAIQQISLNNHIQMKTSIDEACLDATIPPFSLQPLVENSIRHGLESSKMCGTIALDIEKSGSKVKIVISDDGIGMPTQVVAKILKLKKNGPSAVSGSTLVNIIKILNHYFENEFTWDVKSSENKGTTIIFLIPYWPKERGDPSND